MKFQTISFNGQSLTAINQNQTIYVAMKPICENIGLDWEAQRQKIKRNHILNSVAFMLKATAKDGKSYETMCLPLGFLSGWLMSVEVNRVNPEIRDTLIQYQLKCYDVLHQHFMPHQAIYPKPTRALPNGLTGEQIEAVKKLHNALTKSAPKEAQARIAITLWSAVKSKFGCSYKEVPAEQFPEVLSVMSRVAVENGVLYGEVLDREPLPAPQPALLDGLDIERFAVTVYYGAWALEMLEEVALPLRQLGHPKATTMHTLWNESRSFLRHNIQALQRVLPALEPDHAAHVRGSLDRLQRLNARFI